MPDLPLNREATSTTELARWRASLERWQQVQLLAVHEGRVGPDYEFVAVRRVTLRLLWNMAHRDSDPTAFDTRERIRAEVEAAIEASAHP